MVSAYTRVLSMSFKVPNQKFLGPQDAVQAQYVIEKCSELSEAPNGKEPL